MRIRQDGAHDSRPPSATGRKAPARRRRRGRPGRAQGCAAALLLLLVPACSPPPTQTSRPLPASLREVSGLAVASGASVFAHDDEQAIVYEIEIATGRTIRRFSLGSPPARGDFEGIAAASGRIYLITSEGQLLAADIGGHGAQVPFEVHDTGAGAACEVEGLSAAPAPGHLLILCKRPRRGRPEGRILIYQWNIESPGRVERPLHDVDVRDLTAEGSGAFAPSAIEWIPADRQLAILSARDRMLLVLDENGRVVAADRLSPARHRQAEGLAVTGSGELVIADEGRGSRPATLTAYSPDYLRQVLSRFDSTSSAIPILANEAAR